MEPDGPSFAYDAPPRFGDYRRIPPPYPTHVTPPLRIAELLDPPAIAPPVATQADHAADSAFNAHPCTGQPFGPSAPSSSLDPDESNAHSDPPSDIEFRHTWWRDDRLRIDSALQSIFPGSKRLSRFRSCGDAAWVYRSVADPRRVKVCCDTCRNRWCRACQRDRSRIIAGNLRKRLAEFEVKLVTLTLRHRDQPLRHQVDRLLESFRTLRRKPLWKDAIDGGVAFVEVKYQVPTDRWHPHLHILCTGLWIRQADLANTWHAITGDSFTVDIRPVRDLDRVVYYVAKYASKPIDTVLYRHPRRLREAVVALEGRHLCMTFGTFRGWRLTKQTDGDEWVLLGTLESFQRRALEGDDDAIAVLGSLQAAQDPTPAKDKPP